jgi:hypothetical protein
MITVFFNGLEMWPRRVGFQAAADDDGMMTTTTKTWIFSQQRLSQHA